MVTPPYRLLVTGARKATDAQAAFVVQRLDGLYYTIAHKWRLVVIQGRCPYGGVDLVAERWAARTAGVDSESYPADWERYGKAAGPNRNQRMVNLGADMIMAFPDRGSRGTWDCLQKAVNAGIEPRLWPLNIHVAEDAETLW